MRAIYLHAPFPFGQQQQTTRQLQLQEQTIKA